MKIRKGPYGHFVVESIKQTDELYKYAMQVIENNLIDGLLPVYSDEKTSGIELSYDYSGLKSINEFTINNDATQTEFIRNAIRDLFCFIISLLDKLLPLSNLVIDPNYIFYNEKDYHLFFCYIPLESNDRLELSSINHSKLEELLNHDFFKTSLDSDEITTIIYAIKNNEEKLLKEVITNQLQKEQNTNKTIIDRLSFQLLLIFSSLCAIAMFVIKRNEYGVFLSAITLGLFIKVTYDNFKNKKTNTKPLLKEKRTEILFNQEKTATNETDELFSYACLETINPIDGDIKRIGLYSNETTIGSDRFVSDIYIDYANLSDIQAKIIREDNSFWIEDLSKRNNTYLENRSIVLGKRYEIKNGQQLRLGDVDFRFKIGF